MTVGGELERVWARADRAPPVVQLGHDGLAGVRAPLDQLFDALRTFFHQYLDGIGIAQPIARIECVLEMKADLVFVAERGGNSSLR